MSNRKPKKQTPEKEKSGITVKIGIDFHLSKSQCTKGLKTLFWIIVAWLGIGSALNPENIPPEQPEVKIEQMELEKNKNH